MNTTSSRHLVSREIALFLAFLMIIGLVGCRSATEDGRQHPEVVSWVTDGAGLFTEQEEAMLGARLADYERETSHQLLVLTVDSLGGESIEAFSLRTANEWGIGYKGLDNGILITLAEKERQVRIELGLGMEKYISNDQAASIIRDEMVPAFRRGDYFGGVSSGVTALMREARRFVVPPEKRPR